MYNQQHSFYAILGSSRYNFCIFTINQWGNNEYSEKYAIPDNKIEIRIFLSARDKMLIQEMFGEPIHSPATANTNEIKLHYLLQANFLRTVQYDNVFSIDQRAHRVTTTRWISILETSTEKVLDAIESLIQNADL
jgi:hypothetical protein